jgi:hypothetical protein
MGLVELLTTIANLGSQGPDGLLKLGVAGRRVSKVGEGSGSIEEMIGARLNTP